MPLNNEYKRYFIILQEDDKGYEMAAGKIPTGYAKIEIKNGRGKLTAYVQNVKYGEKVDYRMILIAPTKKAAVDMGRLMVDSSGRGELNVEFDADNVMKSAMNISDFMVAAVQTSTATPLSGYTGRDKVQWKNSYHIVNKPQDRIDKQHQQIEEVVAPIQPMPVEMPQLPEVTIPDVEEYVVEEDVVKPVEQVIQEQPVVQPAPKPKKEPVPIQVVTEPVVEQPVIEPAPIPKKEPIPVQVVEEPVVEQPVIEPEPIQVPEPEPIPMPEPIPVTPVEMLPQKPLFEAQTEIKAKFVIETEEKPIKPHYEYKIECPEVDVKDFYFDEESERDSECDSDSDSDSDDRDKKKHHEKHCEEKHCEEKHCEEDCDTEYENNPFFTSPMYRRLEKVLGRLREHEPFDDDSRQRWFRVEDDIYLLNSATIPFMGALMPLGYPFMSNECVMMIGRKDYIIGVKYNRGRKDKKYIEAIMFGIPGMYNKQEERYYSMRGFGDFKPHKSKNYGYWVMTVDIMNGEIVMK